MDKKWQAKWIMDPQFFAVKPPDLFHREQEDFTEPEHRKDLMNHHMLIRKKFNLSEVPKKAVVDITADDYYKLYINGEFIGQGPAPSYYFHYYYNNYEITDKLKKGENVIAVHVYYQGLINRVWNSGDYRQGMIAELFADNNLVLASGEDWKYEITPAYKSGGTTGYETQFLENFDSRAYLPGWQEINFDDSEWENVWVNITDDHCLYRQKTPSVTVYDVQPELVKKLAPGHFFIDFGGELTGQLQLEAEGQKGNKIEIRCGEELKKGEDAKVRYQMRCNCEYQEFWTLSGRGKDKINFYDYKAFRYVEVIGPGQAINPDSIKAVVRHYPLDETACQFESSSEILNSVWEICKNGVKYGSQEGYLDCPSREKGQYLGDATVTGHSQIYVSGDLRLYKKAIKDFALSTFISPGMMAVAPGNLMQEIADYSLQWPGQLLNYYQQSGDREFLEKMYPYTEKLLDYYRQYQREDGLLEEVTEQWNLVDWPKNLRDGYDFDLEKPVGPGCHNVINAFYCGMVSNINRIRDILSVEYEDLFFELKSAFINTFYDREQRLFVDSENSTHCALHSNVLPLLYDLFPQEAQNSIVDLIETKGLNCGVYMSYFVLKGLAEVNEYSLIYDLLTSTGQHSWANMVEEGATTCWEAWGKDQKWNTSLCHAWASAPIPVLIEDIIGLKPAQPGWQEIDFAPRIPDNVEYLDLKVRVNSGEIKVHYKKGEYLIEGPEGITVNYL